MKIKLYNTLSRNLEVFRPENPQKVKIYTCGPTVYSSPHIGNFSAYVYWDLLLRVLKFNGYTPYRVLNLTDVGHLSSDADDGEDKLEKGARLSGKSVWEVAEHYSEEFLRDFQKLNLIMPDVIAKATDYISQDLELIKKLIDKGYTYETRDGIYYDTSKFPRYAEFAKLDLEGLKAGARVEYSSEKKNPSDFALWKFIQPGEKHDMRWDYLGRPGYPGWHIECSAIIHATLGEPIDIHTGGIDHVPVHHTNEIAQSEAAFDRKLAHYWLHCNHLTSEGEKISKSLGNGYTISELEEKGYSALDFKMWVLQGHYRSERDFSIESLEAARIRRLNWRNRVVECFQKAKQEKYSQAGEKAISVSEIAESLNEDLNSAKVFALIDKTKSVNLLFWLFIESVFGLGLFEGQEKIKDTHVENYVTRISIDMSEYSRIANNIEKNLAESLNNKYFACLEKINKLANPILQERSVARLAKDYVESDRLRDELKKYNLTVLDTPEGQIWQYIK